MGDRIMSDRYDLGPCCCCGGVRRARNIVLMNLRAPVPGTGWACFRCGLPADGAAYVACDRCLDTGSRPREVFFGHPSDGNRIPIESLSSEPFEHRMELHPEVNAS